MKRVSANDVTSPVRGSSTDTATSSAILVTSPKGRTFSDGNPLIISRSCRVIGAVPLVLKYTSRPVANVPNGIPSTKKLCASGSIAPNGPIVKLPKLPNSKIGIGGITSSGSGGGPGSAGGAGGGGGVTTIIGGDGTSLSTTIVGLLVTLVTSVTSVILLTTVFTTFVLLTTDVLLVTLVTFVLLLTVVKVLFTVVF